MKKLLVAAVALVVASSAMAGILQVAQDAEAVPVGSISGTAGIVLGLGDVDTKIIGVRGTMGVIDNLLVAVDVGYEIDSELVGLGITAQYTIPVDLPVALAARVGYAAWDFEFEDRGSLEVLAVVSSPIDAVDGLAVYGGIGLLLPLASGADLELMVTGGATYDLAAVDENLAVYAELTYVNDASIGGGAVYAF